VFFVRAHAARAAGEIGAEPLAGDVAALLADTNWWVRSAAKESLFLLGESGLLAASEMLQNEDGFARDSAREVVSSFRRESPPLELTG
jgi:HEAT repeat protein